MSIDVGMLRKTKPRAALIGFITVVVIPCISGYILMRTRKHFGKLAMMELQYQEIIILQSLSSFAGVNGLLTDLKINHSEFGRMVQSCAAVTDLVIFIMASGTVLLKGQKGLPHVMVIVSLSPSWSTSYGQLCYELSNRLQKVGMLKMSTSA